MEAYQQHIFLSDICVQPQRCRGDKVLIVDHTFKKKTTFILLMSQLTFPKSRANVASTAKLGRGGDDDSDAGACVCSLGSSH